MKDLVIGQGHRLLSDVTLADMPIRGIYYTWRKFGIIPDEVTTLVSAIVYRNGQKPARMSFAVTGNSVTLSTDPEGTLPYDDIVELLKTDVATL